jgi:hypothetical protein
MSTLHCHSGMQERVRKDIVAWLNHLRNNVGYDGWRFDFTKGYGESLLLCLHSRSPLQGESQPRPSNTTVSGCCQ